MTGDLCWCRPLLVFDCTIRIHHRPEVPTIVKEQLFACTDLACCIYPHPFVSRFRAGVRPVVRCEPHIRPEFGSFGVVDVPPLEVLWVFGVQIEVSVHLQTVVSTALVAFFFRYRLATIPGNKFSRACVFQNVQA